MLYAYDSCKNLQIPDVFLARLDKKIICALKVYDLKTNLCFNNISSGSFRIYRYENQEETDYYHKIKIGMLIEVRPVSWFQITDIQLDKSNDGNEIMDISMKSLETQLCQTYLTSFGSLASDNDEQGGLDRYCLYNIFDPEHSIMHIFKQKNPGWNIGYIDPDISAQYRAFDAESITSYEFLTDKVSETYECIFQFDVYAREVSAWKLENIGEKTSIFLSDRNLIKSVTVTSNDSDIKTVFQVSGGNDSRTNTPLNITDVNPSGNSAISNFSYFYPQMSEELTAKLKTYQKAMEENAPRYSDALAVLEELYEELNTLKNKIPDDHASTDWTLFGLIELQEKEKSYWNLMSVYMNNDTDRYEENYHLHEAVLSELSVRTGEIESQNIKIKKQLETVRSFIVNIQEFLGDDLYQELSHYVREENFQDDSFIATAEMTPDEILEMQRELMEHARKELAKACYPQFEMEIDAVNFTADYDFIEYTGQLELGNIITIEWEPGILIEARLLEMSIDWSNPDNFCLKFSSKNSLTEKWSLLAEIQKQAHSSGSSIDYNKGAWNIAKQTSLDFQQWINQIFDASLQNLQNSPDQEVLIDETGILLRKWLADQNKYSPGQVWMTNGQIAFTQDTWKSVCTALGEVTLPDGHKVYGLVGQYIVGEIFVGETLKLRGSGAELDLSSNDSISGLETSFRIQNGLFESYIGKINSAGTATDESGRVYTKIRQTEDSVALKVDKNGVISSINLSPETIRIQGSKIQLDGDVSFTNSFSIDGNQVSITNISGGNIKTSTITSAQIAADTITAANIAANTITGDKIAVGTIGADKIKTNELEVGKNIAMGANAVISWRNISGKPNDLAYTGDIPDDNYITEITKDTITTSYINALNVTAKYVTAEGIKAGTINGVSLNFDAVNSVFWTTNDASWTCDSNAIWSWGHGIALYTDSDSIRIKGDYIGNGDVNVNGTGYFREIYITGSQNFWEGWNLSDTLEN